MLTLLTDLKSLADPTRLRIFALLRHGELTVGELVDILEQSQPRVSRHLKLMLEAGLLDRLQEGTSVLYRLSLRVRDVGYLSSILKSLAADDRQLRLDLGGLERIRKKRAEAATAYFNRNAARWQEIRSLHVDEAEVETALLELAGDCKGQRLLDIGTGTARMLELFAETVSDGLGVDISTEMLTFARTRLQEKGFARCHVRRGDMYDLPVADGECDLVIFHLVLHFAETPDIAVREAARTLAPGGRILIADFAPHAREELRIEHAHRRLGFHAREVATWAAGAGLTIAEERTLKGGELDVIIWRLDKPSAHGGKN